MPVFNALKIARPAFLKIVDRADLKALFSPFADYFHSRGSDITNIDDFTEADIENLGDILNSPDNDTPNDLVEALYMITQAAGSDDADHLLEEAEELGIVVVDTDCHEQIAIKIWNHSPGRLKRRYAETVLVTVRSFEYFVAREESRSPLLPPSSRQLQSLESHLDRWFQERNRGRGCKISAHPKGHELWFLIRHGEVYRRVGVWQEGQSGSIGYRPDRYDVVVYDTMTNEIRINSTNSLVRHLYRRVFGECFFNDSDYFPIVGKYTLQPIMDHGVSCLFCDDVKGIDEVRMTRLGYELPGDTCLKRIESSDNVFDALANSDFPIPKYAKLLTATFSIRFSNSRKERTVTIKPANVANYTRDEDGLLINNWLKKRGFTVVRDWQRELENASVLAIA